MTHFRKTYFLSLMVLLPQASLGLGELFDLYDAPQALAMGNAMTADAVGYIASYYNPAGLAKMTKTRPELVLLDVETLFSGGGLGASLSSESIGFYRLLGQLQKNPGDYAFLRMQSVPTFTMRGLGISILGSYQFAGRSDGTNIDLNAHYDVAPTIGIARNFAGNLLKLGVAVKGIIRNELKGMYAHSALSGGDSAIAAKMSEGLAFGADVGAILTLPNKWLPTLGVAWKDVMDTRFAKTSFFNSSATGTPKNIAQSVNAAFSLHPYLGKRLKSTFAAEWKHIELGSVAFRKRFHLGFQLEDERTFYVWLGLNQFYLTGGVALRVKGGNLEIGTWGEEIGEGDVTEQDRRFFMRYTISF